MATDEQIKNRIDELVAEEHKLWDAESRGEATDSDRQRLEDLELTFDQCWDLLRQRRALEEFGLDPMRRGSGRRTWSSATSSRVFASPHEGQLRGRREVLRGHVHAVATT